MNKKRFLLVLLTLAIITSLSAGTLAIYTTNDTPVSSTVQVKKFAFNAVGGDGSNATIKLAPTESNTYTFSVANFTTTATAEVPLDYTISIDYSAALTAMSGLTATLKYGTTAVQLTGTDGKYTFAVPSTAATTASSALTTFAANAQRTDSYSLVLTWANGDNTAQTSNGQSSTGSYALNIKVTAVQHV
jgi:hypothetical protein